MTGILSVVLCAICSRRLWLITWKGGTTALVCPPCDMGIRHR